MSEPLEEVRRWYEEAVAEGLFEPDAMALATASPDGMPSVRIVLLKGIDDRGIRFFTNYGSRKGRELEANPRAAVTIHWATMHRAVRAEGAVERLSGEESDAYFASRGRESRLGAWASRQGTQTAALEMVMPFSASSGSKSVVVLPSSTSPARCLDPPK